MSKDPGWFSEPKNEKWALGFTKMAVLVNLKSKKGPLGSRPEHQGGAQVENSILKRQHIKNRSLFD
jgi:hypothetical protein